MPRGYRFPYTSLDGNPATLMPRLPLTLSLAGDAVEILGLIDSGASVNVIPYSVGVALGAAWDTQDINLSLVGSLGRSQARAIIVQATHPVLTQGQPVELIFAWTRDENAPVLLGQTNFLMEFRVCFDADEATFDIYPRES